MLDSARDPETRWNQDLAAQQYIKRRRLECRDESQVITGLQGEGRVTGADVVPDGDGPKGQEVLDTEAVAGSGLRGFGVGDELSSALLFGNGLWVVGLDGRDGLREQKAQRIAAKTRNTGDEGSGTRGLS